MGRLYGRPVAKIWEAACPRTAARFRPCTRRRTRLPRPRQSVGHFGRGKVRGNGTWRQNRRERGEPEIRSLVTLLLPPTLPRKRAGWKRAGWWRVWFGGWGGLLLAPWSRVLLACWPSLTPFGGSLVCS